MSTLAELTVLPRFVGLVIIFTSLCRGEHSNDEVEIISVRPPELTQSPSPIRERDESSHQMADLFHLDISDNLEPLVSSSDSDDEILSYMKTAETQISYLNRPLVNANNPISSKSLRDSYIIENTRFVEEYPTRCMARTVLKNPIAIEPTFYVARPGFDRTVKATASLDAILCSGFNPNQATTIVIHGYKHTYPTFVWLLTVRNMFRDHSLLGRQNLIFMDWEKVAGGEYSKAAARTSIMGSFLANFLMKLIELGSDPKKMHLIGHSLGAHVAGFAAKRVWPQIGRITGLDPAGPCFGKVFLNSPNDRLSAGDALEVDTYHYDDSFLGSPKITTQIDVFVNGGHSQPGSNRLVGTIYKAGIANHLFHKYRPISESHIRAVEVMAASMSHTDQCQMIAYKCESWKAFRAGECGFCDKANKQCFQMDFHFQSNNKPESQVLRSDKGLRLYVATGQHSPYCLHHFQIKVLTARKKKMLFTADLSKRSVRLKLVNDQDHFIKVTVNHKLHADVHSHLLLNDSNLGRMTKVFFKLSKRRRTKVENVEINYMSNIDYSIRQNLSSRFCSDESAPNKISGQELGSTLWVQLKEC